MVLADMMGGKPEQSAAPAETAEPVEQEGQEDSGDLDDSFYEKPTEEEEDQMERLGGAAMAIAYDDATHDQLVKTLQGGAGNEAQTLATMAFDIHMEVDRQSGGNIPEGMILRAAEQTLDVVIDMANQTGSMQVDETLAAKALQYLEEKLGDAYDFDPAEIQEFISSVDQKKVQGMVQQQAKIAEA